MLPYHGAVRMNLFRRRCDSSNVKGNALESATVQGRVQNGPRERGSHQQQRDPSCAAPIYRAGQQGDICNYILHEQKAAKVVRRLPT